MCIGKKIIISWEKSKSFLRGYSVPSCIEKENSGLIGSPARKVERMLLIHDQIVNDKEVDLSDYVVEKGVEAGGMFCRIMNLSQPRTRFLSLRTDMLQNNLDLPSHTISDWKQFVHEVILDHVEENSEQIGGIDCIVQIDESILEKENIT
ncbi:hypothetical protein TNCV_1045631 [Trichonephila clavipes]|nr:hypothetical protein TNCV_1045631 [Trichonephila clavipes]